MEIDPALGAGILRRAAARLHVIRRSAILNSLAFKLIAGLTAILIATLCPFFVTAYQRGTRERLQSIQDHGQSLAIAIEVGLEDDMLRNDFVTVNRLVTRLALTREVDRILILRPDGTVTVSSEAAILGRKFRTDESGCRECHQTGLRPYPSHAILEAEPNDHRRFRTVTSIENRPACQGCHGAGSALNGLLLIDLSLAEFDEGRASARRRLLWVSSTTLGFTILLVGFMLDRLVHRRLEGMRRTVETARAEGLIEPVPPRGSDEIGVLAETLNRMFDRMERALAELKAQRRYLEVLIDSIEDEIMVVDPEGRIVMLNRSLAAKLGGDPAGVLGRLCYTIVHCQHKDGEGCPALRSFETGRIEQIIEHRPAVDGRMREVEVHSFPIRDEQGRVIQVVVVARDITHRAEMEAQLHHAERLSLVDQLASGVAHEVNNPLGTITACSEGLLARLASPEGFDLGIARKYLETIRRESFRCKNITTNLLEFARRKPSNFGHHDLKPIVESALDLVEYRARSRGKGITRQLEEGLPRAWVDVDKVKQVIINLVLNALDAVERGGEVRVGLTRDPAGRDLVLEVRDNGCGIPPENRERIFEPFFTTKPAGAGTGLGLPICRDIMNLLEGGLSVESRVGEGSTFTARFPLSEPAREPPP